MALAKTQYVRSADADIASQVLGEGPRDVVVGSGIAFDARGDHELKGVPESWTLYAVTG